ncbi:amidohydrolase family protein [Nocardioides solisilvae]|uniref:amidohydrolase family protein n=1 Tax=Nocardioides solisilvae TaxID=1542435 RepID=UPI000D74E9E7|nr:hypothetical protein [Nocardioides solisilvae]
MSSVRLRGTDLTGTVLPVLRDHHVHLGLVDGSLLARGALGAVVDLGWSADVVALAAACPVRVHHAGQFLAAPDGYPSDRPWAPHGSVRPVAHPREAEAAVAEQRALGASVVKVTLHRGAGPVLDLATCSAVVAAAGETPVVAHVEGPGMVELALAAGVDVLAHTPWTEALDADVVAECVAADMAWISTLDIHRHGASTPGQRTAMANLAAFHAAGGRVLYGTDLGNGPLPVGLDLRELALLREAGLDDEALLAALTDGWPAPLEDDLVTFLPGAPDEDLLVRLAVAVAVPSSEVESP